MDNETAAPTPPDDSPAPAATLGSPAPAAPASDAPAPAAPVEEAEPAAEESAEGVEETNPFASFQGVEELSEHPDVKDWHESGLRKAREEAYTELQSHMQPRQQERSQNVTRAVQGMEAINTTLTRAQEDGALDVRAVQDVFRTHRQELAGFTGEATAAGYYTGVEQYLAYLLGPTDAPAFVSRLHRIRDQDFPDETFAADAKKKIVATARQEGYDEGFRKGSKTGQTAAAQKTAIKENKDKGANLAPGASGGSASLNAKRQAYHEGKTNVYPG